MKTCISIVCLLFAAACTEFDVSPEYRVDLRLQPYVDAFFEEASAKGVRLEKTNLIARFKDIGANNGWSRTDKGQHIVEFSPYLVEGNDLRLKIVVFHELGHSLLGRGHIDSRKSIMNTSACINCEIDDYYLTELFLNVGP